MSPHGENLLVLDRYTGFLHSREERKTLCFIELLCKVRHLRTTSTVMGSWKSSFRILLHLLVVQVKVLLACVEQTLQTSLQLGRILPGVPVQMGSISANILHSSSHKVRYGLVASIQL